MTDPLRQLDVLGDTADGFFVADHQGRILRWNRGAERLLGHALCDVLGRPCQEVLAGCDRNGKPINFASRAPPRGRAHDHSEECEPAAH